MMQSSRIKHNSQEDSLSSLLALQKSTKHKCEFRRRLTSHFSQGNNWPSVLQIWPGFDTEFCLGKEIYRLLLYPNPYALWACFHTLWDHHHHLHNTKHGRSQLKWPGLGPSQLKWFPLYVISSSADSLMSPTTVYWHKTNCINWGCHCLSGTTDQLCRFPLSLESVCNSRCLEEWS